MKKLFSSLFLLTIFFSVFCESSLSEKQKSAVINEIIKKAKPEESSYLDSYKGNFTGSGEDEFLIFLGRKYKESEKRQPSIRKTIVAVFSNEELISIHNVPYFTSIDKRCYESGNLGLGISQGWINDFNGNGLDEFFFAEPSGSYLIWEIFEFVDGKFKKTFGPDATLTIKDCNPKKACFSVIHHLYTDSRGYYKDVEKHFIWNQTTKSYEETSEF